MEQQREALLGQIWAAQDEAYDLMYEYDSLPHRYGAHIPVSYTHLTLPTKLEV